MKVKEIRNLIKDRISVLNDEAKKTTNPIDRLVLQSKSFELLMLLEATEQGGNEE